MTASLQQQPLVLVNSVVIIGSLLLLLQRVQSFNFDTSFPLYKTGPRASQFGFAVALHRKNGKPVLLVGSPRANTTQPGTHQAGALYGCELGSSSCDQLRVEYAPADPINNIPDYYSLPPNETKVSGEWLHARGKDGQLLGFSVSSGGNENSKAVVCAPLLRFTPSAFTEGACYVLENDLTIRDAQSTCLQLSKGSRHNTYGACMDGFSAVVDDRHMSVLAHGQPGSLNWHGGVTAMNLRGYSRSRHTMSVAPNFVTDSIRFRLVDQLTHNYDYLGFSVGVGRFGFAHESDSRVTIVSGATHAAEHCGAVYFMPYDKNSGEDFMHDSYMFMTEDKFVLRGEHLAAAFGYSLLVADLSGDDFDELVVGAPWQLEFGENNEKNSGAVYVYFANGQVQEEGAGVFGEPIELQGEAGSQFGLSLAAAGDVNHDGYNDFVVGAPYQSEGGAVFLYHGAASADKFDTKPAQVITGRSVSAGVARAPSAFGWSLAGGMDVDDNGYPDLLVGDVEQDLVLLLRTRPIIHVITELDDASQLSVDKDEPCASAGWAQTCFTLVPKLRVKRSTDDTFDLSRDLFKCKLEIIGSKDQPRRGMFDETGADSVEWPCGANADRVPQAKRHTVYIPRTNRDWLRAMKLKFSVSIESTDETSASRTTMRDLSNLPVLDAKGSALEFQVKFNKKCGNDNTCDTALAVKCTFANLPKDPSGTYIKHVATEDWLDLVVEIENTGERAYESQLYVGYDQQELDRPTVTGTHKGFKVADEGFEEDLLIFSFGNPFQENANLKFTLRFKLARGESEAIGRALEFSLHANSTSDEEDLTDNDCAASVHVIKEAELMLQGVSDPDLTYFGGPFYQAADIQHEEDVGHMITHRYTLTNKGPWSVKKVKVRIDWPYEVQSPYAHGKYALYLMERPVHRTPIPGNVKKNKLRYCSIPLAAERVNPYELTVDPRYILDRELLKQGDSDRVKTIKGYEYVEGQRAVSYELPSESRKAGREAVSLSALPRGSTPIKTTEFTDPTGEVFNVVKVGCRPQPGMPQATAKCFPIECHFDSLGNGVSATIEIRARLWNATFVEDYRNVDFVTIESFGQIILDESEGIRQESTDNDQYSVVLRAYPDMPKLPVQQHIPIWWLILAVLIALLILALIFCLCWKCGFFKRNRSPQSGGSALYKAEFHTAEQWTTET